MADKDRIQRIILKLATAWLRVPDATLGELIGAISEGEGELILQVERENGMASNVALRRLPADLSSLTDEWWEVRLATLLGET